MNWLPRAGGRITHFCVNRDTPCHTSSFFLFHDCIVSRVVATLCEYTLRKGQRLSAPPTPGPTGPPSPSPSAPSPSSFERAPKSQREKSPHTCRRWRGPASYLLFGVCIPDKGVPLSLSLCACLVPSSVLQASLPKCKCICGWQRVQEKNDWLRSDHRLQRGFLHVQAAHHLPVGDYYRLLTSLERNGAFRIEEDLD